MWIYVHRDCGQPAAETPDVMEREVPSGFPFVCLNCLEDIESESDLMSVERMSQ